MAEKPTAPTFSPEIRDHFPAHAHIGEKPKELLDYFTDPPPNDRVYTMTYLSALLDKDKAQQDPSAQEAPKAFFSKKTFHVKGFDHDGHDISAVLANDDKYGPVCSRVIGWIQHLRVTLPINPFQDKACLEKVFDQVSQFMNLETLRFDVTFYVVYMVVEHGEPLVNAVACAERLVERYQGRDKDFLSIGIVGLNDEGGEVEDLKFDGKEMVLKGGSELKAQLEEAGCL